MPKTQGENILPCALCLVPNNAFSPFFPIILSEVRSIIKTLPNFLTLLKKHNKQETSKGGALEQGDYDWSHQAMDHWPERVKEKCKTNKFYAVAHGLA